MDSMNDINSIFNQTLFRCLYQFKTYCTPSCGQFQSSDIVSACVNISIQAILDRMMYNIDTRVNDQYEADVAVPLYGYITPVLAIVTTIFNMLIFCVLSKKSFRSPTNFILICIAVCDTITILSPLTWYVHTYSSNGYQDYPIYTWCLIHRYFGSLIPICFHNSAVWLTVMLSIHRYIGISHPNLARILCCYKAVITGTIGIFVLLIILIFSLLIFEEIEKVTVISKDMLNSQGLLLIETCYFKKSSNIFYDSYATYFKVYPSLRVVLCNIIPCILLIAFNILLIRTTYQSYRYRQKLLKGSIKRRNFEVAMIVRTTIMLLSICFLTLLVEVPYGIIISLQVIQSIWEISVPSLKLWITFQNFILFLTYPTHFIIYVTMNRRFRTYLVNIFCRRRRIDGINSISGSMEAKVST